MKKDSSSDCGSPNCNVVLISVDALRADHVGCYGYSRNITPNIDGLAKEGILFKNAFAQSSWTRPSVASILTGMYPKNHGVQREEDALSPDIVTLPEVLKVHGYATCAFIACGNIFGDFGFNRGYDSFVEFNLTNTGSKEPRPYYADEVNSRVFDVLDEVDGKSKNFIYIHYIGAHSPYIPKERVFSRPEDIDFGPSFFKSNKFFRYTDTEQPEVLRQMRDAYDDKILFNDTQIGLLLGKIRELGIYDKSIIIVMSDHGEEFLEHGSIEHCNSLFEESMKIPLIIRMPNKPAAVYEGVVEQVDVMPTVLSTLGVALPSPVDGVDVFNDTKPEFAYAELYFQGIESVALRSANGKLIRKYVNYAMELDAHGKGSHRWFQNGAEIHFQGDLMEIPIMSFHENKSITLRDGKRNIGSFTITPEWRTIGLSFEDSKDRKILIVPSTKGIRPIHVQASDDERCLNFAIGANKYFDLTAVRDFEYLYFNLVNDSAEKHNLYYNSDYYGEVDRLSSKLDNYLSDRRNLISNKTKANYSEEALNQLRAMGYLR